jgi:hypothetical protein
MSAAAKPGFIRQQYAFAAHIRDPQNNPAPEDIEDRRLGVYRELFFNNVEGFLSSSFPVLRQLLDEQDWLALARDFFARHHCRSPLFLEIPREFLNYLDDERGRRDSDPPFLRELAHYEWVELALSVAESGDSRDVDPQGDLPAGRPVLSTLAWPLVYQYPVHRIRPEFRPEQPGDSPVYLLAYRDSSDEVGFIELNPVSARLFALLQEHPERCGLALLEQIAGELQHPHPEQVIEGGKTQLEQWRRLGIVRGTAVETAEQQTRES